MESSYANTTFTSESGPHHFIGLDTSSSGSLTGSVLSLLPAVSGLGQHKSYILPTIVSLIISWIAARSLYVLFIRAHLSPLRHLPSPKQPLSLFRLLHEPNGQELEDWMHTIPHNGLIRYFGLWNEERVFVASPEGVKDLLVAKPYDFIKAKFFWILAKNIAAEGLLILEGQEHKAARKVFNPAYSPESIRKTYGTMWGFTAGLANVLQKESEKETSEKAKGVASLLKPISAASIDIIGRLGFSRDFHSLADKKGSFGRAYVNVFKTTPHGQWTLDRAAKIGPELALKLPLRAVKTITSVMAFVRNTAEGIVQEHEEAIKHGIIHDDMLSTLMKANHFSHDKIVDQTIHTLASATETVSGTMAWAFHLLSRHPEIQTRLREEIRKNIPSLSSDSTPENLHTRLENLPYLNAVLKEVLRFHSINTILWRETLSPTASILGTHIPVGTRLAFSPWILGRDPKHWGPDARTFNPDRWLDHPTTGGADNSYSFLTFGAGSRRCIGENYAKAQMRCIVAGVVGRFELAPLEGRAESESDTGEEIGDFHALTLFKIFEGWELKVQRVDWW